MKATTRRRRNDTKQFESLEALRERLAAFGLATRDSALRRAKVEEPIFPGPVLVGRRVRRPN